MSTKNTLLKEQAAKPIVSEKLIILIAGLGMFLSTLDAGIINVALPSLASQFKSSISHISWVITLYTLVLSATIVTFGRLSDRYGKVRFYAYGLWVFGIASLLCGSAMSANSLLLFRAIQGIGAALLQATAAALITTLILPERRAAALSILGMMIGLGPILGPSVGGILLSLARLALDFLVKYSALFTRNILRA